MLKVLKKHIVLVLITAIMVLPMFSYGQYFRGTNWWKQYRNEVGFAIGASNVLSDLGGRDQVGSRFIYDLELAKTRYAISGHYKYYVKQKVAVNTSFSYARLSGDDALTNEIYRRNRNLNFKTPIVELAVVGEYHFSEAKAGSLYKLKGARGKKGYAVGSYIFGGVGLFYFNPREISTGTKLRPLRTEGQGLPGGPKPYKPFAISFPLGFGFNYGLNATSFIGIRAGYRFTTTDYIDDVSGNYYIDPALQAQEYGQASVEFANPGFIKSWGGPGNQRGNASDNDGFGFIQITYEYKLAKNNSKYGRGKRIKTRRSMPSF
jgi:hypothetical protein